MTSSFWLPSAAGTDPYDCLRSRRLPGAVRASRRLRQIAIQTRKQLPFDLAPILGIQPYVMAKTVGCLLWAEARASASLGITSSSRAERLVQLLDSTEGNAGRGGWGYEFDVQTRWAFYAAGSPNLIATTFVGRGLLAAGTAFGREDWVNRGIECAGYATDALLRWQGDDTVAFYYTPDTDRLIHNANLLGCALCAEAAALSGDDRLLAYAQRAAAVTISAQAADGSWPYGVGSSLSWIDSFHTAYNLDGLLQMWLVTGADEFENPLRRGIEYWASEFFGEDGTPHYYSDRVRPLDIHCAATAVDVGSRLASWGFMDAALPLAVSDWTRRNLIDPATGAAYYRRGRLFTDKRSFARWGDAHWALGRASLSLLSTDSRDLVECRVKKGFR